MPKLNSDPLNEDQVQVLVRALGEWAESHPRPNNPVIAFADGEALTPRQLVLEVRERTPNGEAFLRMVQCGLEVMPFDQIISGFVRQE
jgi:hypothetical protein